MSPSFFAVSMSAIISRSASRSSVRELRSSAAALMSAGSSSGDFRRDAAELDDMTADRDAELAERSFRQIAPAATRAVVSRADARSRMSRASSRSYLSMPGKVRVTRDADA